MTAATMAEVVEAAARAIHDRNILDHATIGETLKPYDRLPTDAIAMLHDKARSALVVALAMLGEPTEEMVDQCIEPVGNTYPCDENRILHKSEWRAMIDARIAELDALIEEQK